MFEFAADDKSFQNKLIELRDRYQIDTLVETGIDKAGSTPIFASIFKRVISIDIKQECVKNLEDKHIGNVTAICSDSASWLRENIDSLGDNTIFFLDAHWGKDNPLGGELRAIAKSNKKSIVVVHDCYVPNEPRLGFDDYRSQFGFYISYDYISPNLRGWDHYYEYNSFVPEMDSVVGIIYLYPRGLT